MTIIGLAYFYAPRLRVLLLLQTLVSLVAVTDAEDQEERPGDTALALQATALTVLSVVASGANTLVAIVFYRRPALRSPSNRSDRFFKLIIIKLKDYAQCPELPPFKYYFSLVHLNPTTSLILSTCFHNFFL
jgi:hypothetical protein